MSITAQILRQLETRADRSPLDLPAGRGTVRLSNGGGSRGTIQVTAWGAICALDCPDENGADRWCFPWHRIAGIALDFVEEPGDGQEAGE
jgi:hypothetical protein